MHIGKFDFILLMELLQLRVDRCMDLFHRNSNASFRPMYIPLFVLPIY